MPPPRQAYFDWLSWPLTGVEELDEEQCQPAGGGPKGRVLARPSRLYWAGEATHKEDAYTVQGAIESGEAKKFSGSAGRGDLLLPRLWLQPCSRTLRQSAFGL